MEVSSAQVCIQSICQALPVYNVDTVCSSVGDFLIICSIQYGLLMLFCSSFVCDSGLCCCCCCLQYEYASMQWHSCCICSCCCCWFPRYFCAKHCLTQFHRDTSVGLCCFAVSVMQLYRHRQIHISYTHQKKGRSVPVICFRFSFSLFLFFFG